MDVGRWNGGLLLQWDGVVWRFEQFPQNKIDQKTNIYINAKGHDLKKEQ
jgi:hypothetical protein